MGCSWWMHRATRESAGWHPDGKLGNLIKLIQLIILFFFILLRLRWVVFQSSLGKSFMDSLCTIASWQFQLSPVFSFPCVSPPVALINLILMVCCHVRAEGHKSDLQAKMMIFALSPKQVSLKNPTDLMWTTTQIFCSFLFSGPSFYLAWQNP